MKNQIKLVLSLAVVLFLAMNVSAACYSNCYSNYPSTYSDYSSNSGNSQESYKLNPISNTNQYYNSKTHNSNYDSSDYDFAYQGPLASSTVTYNEYLKIKPSGKVIRTVSYSDKQTYAGETAFESYDTQNRRLSTSNTVKTSDSDYFGGFSWSKKASFDNVDSTANSRWNRYYYKPVYSDNYFNWDW